MNSNLIMLRGILAKGNTGDVNQGGLPPPSPESHLIRMSFGDQARAVVGLAFRQAWRNIGEARKREGGLLRDLCSRKPRSVDEQCAYAREKRWVPYGHDDGMADKAGIVYHNLIGVPGVAFFDACSGIIGSPFAASVTFAAVYAVTVLALFAAGEHIVALAMAVGLAVTVIGSLIGLEAWSAASRRAAQPPPPDDQAADPDPDAGIGY